MFIDMLLICSLNVHEFWETDWVSCFLNKISNVDAFDAFDAVDASIGEAPSKISAAKAIEKTPQLYPSGCFCTGKNEMTTLPRWSTHSCREHEDIFVTLDLKWFLSCRKFVLVRLSKSLEANGWPRRVGVECDRCSQAGRERYLASYNLRRIVKYFRFLGFYRLVSELHPLCGR